LWQAASFVLPKSTCIPNLESGVIGTWGGINGQPQGQDWFDGMYDIRDNVVAGLTLAKQIMDVVKVFFTRRGWTCLKNFS